MDVFCPPVHVLRNSCYKMERLQKLVLVGSANQTEGVILFASSVFQTAFCHDGFRWYSVGEGI